jgi:hypothetical protein
MREVEGMFGHFTRREWKKTQYMFFKDQVKNYDDTLPM